MNVQKLGLVLGVNMVAACLMMQGCAAPGSAKAGKSASTTVRTGTSLPPSSPSDKPIITVTPPNRPVQPVVPPAPEPPVVTPQPTTPPPVAVADKPVVSQPSSVRTVKALPPPASKKPKAKKPAAAPAAAATAQPAAATTEYVVKPGDTLFLISKRTNYRQSAIIAANPGLKPERLRVGQKIKMPGAVAAPAVAKTDAKPAAKDKDGKVLPAAAPSPAAADTKAPVKTKSGYVPYEGPTKEYVVKSGDSLGKIAGESGWRVPFRTEARCCYEVVTLVPEG